MAEYSYTAADLRLSLSGHKLSQFDRDLQSRWNGAMAAGQFRYDLDHLKTKVIPGPHGYVALLNVKRAKDRRPPQSMHGLNQPFNGTKFNFNKINDREVLQVMSNRDEIIKYNDKIIINVSPADYCHSLIVPQVDENHNQNLSEHGIKLSLDVMCLSAARSFKIGFNSLCAHASVNHQHLHCYYTDQHLLAERMTGSRLCRDMFILDSDAPTGFGFELTRVDDIKKLSRVIFSCTDFMRRSEVAHALFMCRGVSFSDRRTPVIRILLWPRKKLLGPKPSEPAFNSAVLEMAGHLLIKDKECFETITDECAYRALQDASLPDDEFEELTESLVKIVNAHS